MIPNTRALLRWRAQSTLVSQAAKQRPATLLSPASQVRARIGLESRSLLAPLVHRQFYAKIPQEEIDLATQKENAQKKIKPRPLDQVTTESTTRQVFEPSPAKPGPRENVTEGLKHDVSIVKDTFNMADVPKEPFALGLAGTLPYLGTSLATVYLSWDLNTEWPTGSALLNHLQLNHTDAQALLNLIEPIQLGYGAIIISFLGAVHWGMEYTASTPDAARTKFRYGLGVIAPIIAWPTLLMPIEAALTAQFAAFSALYFADTRASTRGWAPTWYARYRFILTAVVGLAIFVSLVGRSKIGSAAPRLGQGLSDRVHVDLADTKTDWAKLEAEERKKNREKKQKEKEEAEEKAAKAKREEKESSEGKGNKKESKDQPKTEGKQDEGKESKKSKDTSKSDEQTKEEGKEGDKKEAKDKKDKKDEE